MAEQERAFEVELSAAGQGAQLARTTDFTDVILFADEAIGLPSIRAACESIPELLPWVFPIMAPFSLLLKLGKDYAISAADRRAMLRVDRILNWLIVQHNRTRDWIAEIDADRQMEFKRVLEQVATEGSEQRLRYLTELLDGLLSDTDRLEIDRHNRFRNWVNMLELASLEGLHKYQAGDNSQTVINREQLVSQYDRQVVKGINYLKSLSRLPWRVFLADLEAAGIAQFDRGGGGATYNEQAHVVMHYDLDDFADRLRRAAKRKPLD